MRKANQNIATLLSRIAKYDIQMQAEKDDGHYGVPLAEEHNWHHLLAQAGIEGGPNVQDLIANDGLNDEIKKLL